MAATSLTRRDNSSLRAITHADQHKHPNMFFHVYSNLDLHARKQLSYNRSDPGLQITTSSKLPLHQSENPACLD